MGALSAATARRCLSVLLTRLRSMQRRQPSRTCHSGSDSPGWARPCLDKPVKECSPQHSSAIIHLFLFGRCSSILGVMVGVHHRHVTLFYRSLVSLRERVLLRLRRCVAAARRARRTTRLTQFTVQWSADRHFAHVLLLMFRLCNRSPETEPVHRSGFRRKCAQLRSHVVRVRFACTFQ